MLNGSRAALLALIFSGAGCSCPLHAQPASVKDCEAVLKTRDLYSFAQQNNLSVDYLRTIDDKTFEQIKHDGAIGASALLPVGLFSGNASYSDFDEKRRQYFESVHYSRNESQATNLLEITTSPRAYTAYSDCLSHLSQVGLVAWVAKEDTNSLELHVKFENPTGVGGVAMDGTVTGGTVTGMPAGHIFRDGTRWGIRQERVFTIKRRPGISETTVIVSPADGSTPFTKTYYRADATLAVSYIGDTPVLRTKGRSTTVGTPNNNENKGRCPNEVGRAQGGYCISRTPISISTTAPHYFQNASLSCPDGPRGCWWAKTSAAVISPDGLTASGYFDNWGSAVTGFIYVDEYEHLSKAQCGGDGPLPVVFGQTVVLTTSKECVPIASVRAKNLTTNGSEEVAQFGAATTPNATLTLQSTLDLGVSLQATYKVLPGKPLATLATK